MNNTAKSTGLTSMLTRLRGTNNEGILAGTLIVLVLAMGLVNPDFWSVATAFGIARSSMVDIVFALGVLMVIITRQIDVSFPVVGIFAAYSTVVLVDSMDTAFGAIPTFLVAGGIGTVLGLVNGAIIARLQLPALIITLGTVGIFRGGLLTYVGSKYIGNLPDALNDLSRTDLFVVTQGGSTTRLHVFIVPVVLLCIAVSLFLNRTIWGRGLYAIGGDIESARRAGLSVPRIQLTLYASVGLLAGIAGMMYVTLARTANPHEFAGTELDIIAAVVLGGASILGGRGSVVGTVLGVVLIAVIRNSLLLMGVPSTWQRAAVGILLILGITAQMLGSRRRARPGREPDVDAAAPTSDTTSEVTR